MEAEKKRKRRNILFAVFAVLVIALLILIPFLLDAQQKAGETEASILSAVAETGVIRKTLSGAGTLTEQDAEEVSVPEGVEVTGYLVKNGQAVRKGDPVARVEKSSVMETISAVREAMDEVEKELDSMQNGSDYTYITAPASGRVKAVYAKEGDTVQEVILQHGALAVLSVDGLMAVHVPAGPATAIGNAVTVELSDGTETAGRVETVVNREATVTFSDEYGVIGETANVRDSGGSLLGSGSLFVHSPWKAMATGGTVFNVYAQENREISVYGTMIVLNGTAMGGNYEELLAEHRAYEDIMADLFRMYQDGCLTAPCDGIVSGVDEDILKTLSSSDTTPILSLLLADSSAPAVRLLANAPPDNSDDIFTNVIGIVSDTSGSVVMQNWSTEVEDYSDTDFLVTASESFTRKTTLPNGFPTAYQWNHSQKEVDVFSKFEGDQFAEGTKYYEKSGQSDTEYVETTDTTPEENKQYYTKTTETIASDSWGSAEIKPGRIYIFAFDGSDRAVFMVYLGDGILPKTDDEKSDKDKDKDKNGEKQGGGSPQMPSGAGAGMSGMGGGSGASGAPSGSSAEPAATQGQYSIESTTILSVTPQETVSVSITVDELDILSVHTGQEATVTLDALKGQSFSGIITEVNTIASNEGGNSKYSAVVELKRTDRMLGGMNASASITVEERENVLLIPSEALAEQNAESVVYTAYDAKTQTLSSPVRVKTGLSDGNQVQILSGLQEGDTVWYSYYDTLEIEGLPGGFPRL